jgi:glycosyltransferase involved in cell wall biosynthesis
MSCGTPVVVSNRTSMPEVAGDAAIFFDPADLASTVGAITSVLESADLRASLKQRGLKRATQFNWHTTGQLTAQAYLQALS